MPQVSESASFGRLMRRLRDDPVRFNKVILGRVHPSIPGGYWPGQVPVLESVLKNKYTLVPAGHACGKSFLASGSGLHYLYTRSYSRVILYGPSAKQVSEVLWPETVKAWRNSRIKLPGRLLSAKGGQKIEITDKWDLTCATADSDPEAMAGRHAAHMLVIADEASWDGYDDVLETLLGLNAERYLLIGNPLRNGKFRQLCDRADNGDPLCHKITISSLDSPHAHLERSPVGLADKGYLDSMASQYGEDSPVYRVRVKGIFNDDDIHQLLPSAWLSRCTVPHPDGDHGPKTLAIDLSKGTGQGDSSVITVKDRNNLVYMESSSQWTYPEGTLVKVKEIAARYGVSGDRIRYDRGGLGEAFGYLLRQHGLGDAYGYVGGSDGGKLATNLRGAAALALKRRLDPNLNPLHFHIPETYLQILRPQINELRYELALNGRIKIEPKDEMRARLGRSPDHLDSLLIQFSKHTL